VTGGVSTHALTVQLSMHAVEQGYGLLVGVVASYTSTCVSEQRNYPRRTLEQALRIPAALKEKNGGNPWAPDQVATALGVGAKGGNFYYVAAASRDYGLTTGSRDTAEIALTELGRRAVYPQSGLAQTQAYMDAFLHVDVFARVLQHYGGNNLPEKKFLTNTLEQTFSVDPEFHDEFVDVFTKNCRFLGIGEQFTAGVGGGVRTPGAAAGAVSAADVASITVATPEENAGDAPTLFVIMPFTERDDRHETGFFREVLAQLFVPAGKAAGFAVKTAKRQGSDVIQSTIVNDLLEADLVLADLTEHNPNVLFELGMRMHADLPVVLVRARGTGPIFDVDNMLRVEEYSPNLWTTSVKGDVPILTEHIKAAWEDRATAQTFMKILRPEMAAGTS
jgi:hypothetical protein